LAGHLRPWFAAPGWENNNYDSAKRYSFIIIRAIEFIYYWIDDDDEQRLMSKRSHD
jgi:hypothetical protein